MTISKDSLFERREIIESSPHFYAAGLKHCQIMVELYRSNPLLYKYILTESRLNIVLALSCFTFGNQTQSLSAVKELCARYHISGQNRIIAILDFFRFNGHIVVQRDRLDRRKQIIIPTEKALANLKSSMRSVFEPLQMLYPEYNLCTEHMNNDKFREAFFQRTGSSLSQGLIFDQIYPQAMPFIDKSAGRIFILRMYQLMINEGVVLSAENCRKLMQDLHISRSHFSRLASLGYECGFFIENYGGLTFTLSFRAFVERYIALYLAWGYLFIPPWALGPDTDLPS